MSKSVRGGSARAPAARGAGRAGGPRAAPRPAALTEQGIEADSAKDVVNLARSGAPQALQLLREAGRDIGEVLAASVNLLNPAILVVGGQMILAGDHLLAGIREVIYQRSLPLATQHLRIVPARTGESSGVIGAAVMVIEYSLSPDRIDGLVGA
jgi:predicted NBD/HSP70 family sugar kinase